MLSRTISKLADTVREKNTSKDFEERLTYNASKQLYRRLPILSFLKDYSLQKCLADLIAGISVGLVLIPQGIAYAVVAKLPAEVGLYSSVMGCFLYIIFGTSPELSNAPAAITALMTGIYGAGDISVAIFQSFMGGILILAAGIFNLGILHKLSMLPKYISNMLSLLTLFSDSLCPSPLNVATLSSVSYYNSISICHCPLLSSTKAINLRKLKIVCLRTNLRTFWQHSALKIMLCLCFLQGL